MHAASLLCPFRVARISRLIGNPDTTTCSASWQVVQVEDATNRSGLGRFRKQAGASFRDGKNRREECAAVLSATGARVRRAHREEVPEQEKGLIWRVGPRRRGDGELASWRLHRRGGFVPRSSARPGGNSTGRKCAQTQKSTAEGAVLHIPALVTGLPAIYESVVVHRTI